MWDRCCKDCRRELERSSYSNNQWSKGVGASRCNSCVHGSGATSSVGKPTARTNNSTKASFSHDALTYPFAQGAFRWVAKGKYTEGPRNGEPCVAKWFKTGVVFKEEYFKKDLKVVEKALDILEQWNNKGFVNRAIKLNKPGVWTFTPCRQKWSGSKAMTEPFIEDYQKFNSNTGWNDASIPWARVMQAVSHFSYHASAGQFVLCDLQGGVYRDGVVLTDPVILSRSGNYGPTDLGPMGISSFFSRHKCNEFCRSIWQKPADCKAYFEAKEGTSMTSELSKLSLVPGRRPMSNVAAIVEEEEDVDESVPSPKVVRILSCRVFPR